MSEANIEYRGRFIDVQSFESGGKRWRPKAVVSIYQGGALPTRLVSAPVEVLLDSEVAADTYSLAMAKKWIDDQLEGGRLEGKTEKRDAPGGARTPTGAGPTTPTRQGGETMSEAEYSSAAARPRRDGRSLRELFGAELALHGITWCRGGGHG